VRTKSGVPTVDSMAPTWIDTADCVRCSSVAALEMLPSRATVWNAVNCFNVATFASCIG
jgi:hypothetical protein